MKQELLYIHCSPLPAHSSPPTKSIFFLSHIFLCIFCRKFILAAKAVAGISVAASMVVEHARSLAGSDCMEG